jgi:hypothetical protein
VVAVIFEEMMSNKKKRIIDLLNLMLQAFMEDELKWYPMEKAEALEELEGLKKRVKGKWWSNRKMKKEVNRKLKRLERWRELYPLHRADKLYTTLTIKWSNWEKNTYHVQFDVSNVEHLSCKIVAVAPWAAETPIGDYFKSYTSGSLTHDRVTDEEYPDLVTLLYLIHDDSVVQKIENIPSVILTKE